MATSSALKRVTSIGSGSTSDSDGHDTMLQWQQVNRFSYHGASGFHASLPQTQSHWFANRVAAWPNTKAFPARPNSAGRNLVTPGPKETSGSQAGVSRRESTIFVTPESAA